MAIHDVGKDSPGRENPQPNSHDLQGEARPAASTVSINPHTDASPSTGYIRTTNSQIIINDGTNDRIIIGYLQNGF